MILVSASASVSSMCHGTGANAIGEPSRPRDRIDPSSNRKPSTCNSFTQYWRHSTIIFSTIGWLQLRVLPQPE